MGIKVSKSKSKFELTENGQLKEEESVRPIKMSYKDKHKASLMSDVKGNEVKDEAQTGANLASSDGTALDENKNNSEIGAFSKPFVIPQGEGSKSLQSEEQSEENHMFRQENSGTVDSKTEEKEKHENENKEVCFSKEQLANTTHQTCSSVEGSVEGKDIDCNVTLSENENEMKQSKLAKNEVPALSGDSKSEMIHENPPQDSQKDQTNEVTTNNIINNEDDHKVATDANEDAKEIDEKTAENLSVNDNSGGSQQDHDANYETKQKAKVEETENKTSEHCLSDNLKFYRGEIASKPFPGERITEILKWKGDYKKLEYTHSYIQWLFPISEGRGMNYSAQALQDHEAEAIREDDKLRGRVLEAYKMMLDFYGMELEDENTGKVKRGDNWKERYEHLNKSIHNHFRITRILKALGELGLEHLQTPWLKFIMEEATVNKALPKLRGGSMDHWIGAIKDPSEQINFYKVLSDLNDQTNKPVEEDKKEDNKVEERADKIHNSGLGDEMVKTKPENIDGSTGDVTTDLSDTKDLNNPSAAEGEVDKNTSKVDNNLGGINDTATVRNKDDSACDIAIEQTNEHNNTGSDSKIQPTDKLEHASDANGLKEDANKTKDNKNENAFSEEQNDTNNHVGDTINPDQTHCMTNDASSVEKKLNNSSITTEIEEDKTRRADDVSNHHFVDGENKTMDTNTSHGENIQIEPGSQEMQRTAKGSLDNGTCDSGHDFLYIDEAQ